MNRRLLLVFAPVILAVSVGIWLLRERPSPPAITQATPAPTSKTNLADNSVMKRSVPPGQPPSEPTPPGYGGLSDPRWKEREEKLRIDDVYEWKMPINFYGRVLNANELPIAGAKVHFQWSDISDSGASSTETVSDASGRFELTGKQGNGLTVRIAKDGYYTPRKIEPARFENARFWDVHYYEPNPSDPVLFHLRKKGEGEHLVHQRVKVRLSSPGVPTRFDLFNEGRISPQGQLEVAAVTNAERYPPRVYDWWATVAVPAGGLLEFTEEFPFEAPEAGYVPRVEFKMPAAAPDWRPLLAKDYFIRFGNPPKYGRVEVNLDGASQSVILEYWVNPSGSPNLEPSVTAEDFPR